MNIVTGIQRYHGDKVPGGLCVAIRQVSVVRGLLFQDVHVHAAVGSFARAGTATCCP